MATITVGGLATGLDTNSIISQLVAVAQQPLNLLQNQLTQVQGQQSAVQTFNTKLLAVLNAADKLRDPSGTQVGKATSSDTTVLSAVAGSGAVNGSTTVTVNSLATQSIALSSNGVASADSTVASSSGNFSFQVGSGAVQTIAVNSSTTLSGLATAINGLGAGVTASVVNVGTGSSPDFRLRIASNATGNDNALQIQTDGTNLGVGITQAATNASLTVSGFPTAITRDSNTISDVIPGVTLNLTHTGGPVTVSVATDTDAVTTNVQAFVNAFNDLVSYVNSQSTVTQQNSSSTSSSNSSSTDNSVTAGPLAFDSTVRSVLDQLHGVVSSAIGGSPSGGLAVLSQIGITTQEDGTLAFNSGQLQSALTQDPNSVTTLFAGNGASGGVADRLHDLLFGITQPGGLIATRSSSLSDQIKSLNNQIDTGQQQLDAYQQDLQQTFANLELLVNNLKSQGASLLSALGVGTSSSSSSIA
jgi:flagellar hook-associated protein 2